MGEITLGENCAGRTLDELAKDLPRGVQVTMVRKGQPISFRRTISCLAPETG